jgi:hypothetical protein
MPNWKKVIVSGSDALLNEITSSGGIKSTDVNIDDWGSVSASLASIEAGSTSTTLQEVTDNGAIYRRAPKPTDSLADWASTDVNIIITGSLVAAAPGNETQYAHLQGNSLDLGKSGATDTYIQLNGNQGGLRLGPDGSGTGIHSEQSLFIHTDDTLLTLYTSGSPTTYIRSLNEHGPAGQTTYAGQTLKIANSYGGSGTSANFNLTHQAVGYIGPSGGTSLQYEYLTVEGANYNQTDDVEVNLYGDIIRIATTTGSFGEYPRIQLREFGTEIYGNLSVDGSGITGMNGSITGSALQLGNLGAANEILIVGTNTEVTSSNLLSIDTANQRLGIGTSTPEVKLDIVGESSGEAQVRVAQHDNTNDGPDIRFFKSHGTAASPTAIANGDYIGAVNAFAYNGSSYLQSGFFGFQADGIDGDTTFGLRTRVDGTLADRIAINAVGDVNIAENLTVTGDITASAIETVTASIDYALINDKLQGNGSGFQFFAYNEDTIKTKFANWYSSNDRQYGMGQLWYETWFAAIDNQAGRDNRRIGFYLEKPDAGASDAAGGTGAHPSNARFYVDINGGYLSGSLNTTGDITGSDITIDDWGSVSASLSTIESDITGISGGVITPIQLVVDTKNLSDGNVAWYGISDLQTNPNRAYTTWIAPANGYLDEVVVSPEQTNSTTDDVTLSFMKNAGNQGSVGVAMGAAGTNKTFTFGPGTYSFVKGDRVGLLFGKNTNTADLYNVMVTFRLSN